MPRSAWVIGAVLTIVATAAFAEPVAETPPPIEELIRRVDPAFDDWVEEARQSEAAERLAHLAAMLAAGETPGSGPDGVLAGDARSTPLRPESPRRERLAGGLEVARFSPESGAAEASTPAAQALRALVAPLRAAKAVRFEFKIVGVQAPPDGSLRTRVRFEAAGRLETGIVQQTAYWRITWAAGAEGRALQIAELRLESFEEVSRPAFMFSDSTNAVLPADAVLHEHLRLGGEFWHGRIDAIGEPNLMGHQGIAVGDVNADGLDDLYVAMGTGLPNLLLVQAEDGTVRDTAGQAGVDWLDDTKGVIFADMDNDGDQDLLTAIGPTIVLAKNDGQGKFERFISMRAPTPASFYSLSVADYDLDGDLDIYGTRYVKVAYGVSVPLPFHDANNGPTNHLLRNDGDDRFADVTGQTGLDANNARFSLIGAWGDYDADGDPDLYVANDFGRNNLYRNDGGKFVDVAARAGAEDQAAGMGVSWSDYDLDGDLDLYVTNMYSAAGNRIAYQPRFKSADAEEVRRQVQRHSLGNTLLANEGDGTFRDVSDEAGVRMGRWGWGAKFVDLNNDGRDDLVAPNGFLTGALADDL